MGLKATLKVLGAKAYRNRSTIETIAGLTCFALGTGFIIKNAKEAVKVSCDLEEKFDAIHKKDATNAWVDKKERSKEVRSTLMYGVKGYTKAYWLGVTFELIGGTLVAVSDITQAKELSATSALLATTSATLSAIKERVIADQGEEKWQEYLLGPQFETVDVMPDGTIIQTTKPVENPNASAGLPPHCFFFDESNFNWEKDPYMNKKFLEDHERWLDQRLDKEEFLFENDIRRDIGAELTMAGWTSGILKWKIDPVTGERVRNYFSFGLDAKNPAAQRFRDGVEPTILLQPNVEDNIIDQLNLPLI